MEMLKRQIKIKGKIINDIISKIRSDQLELKKYRKLYGDFK